MRIVIYSSVFYPSVGGIETVSETLADHLTRLGAKVCLVTETEAGSENRSFAYPIVRKPSKKQRLHLVREADLVYSNGASVALFFYAKLFNKPFVWTHAGYQLQCIDGAGCKDGEPTPLTPVASVLHYLKAEGLRFALVQAFKLFLRRFVGRFVDKNIAITHWVAKRQPLPNQVVIYNPFPLERFEHVDANAPIIYDFIYVGRLTSEKGVMTLLRAFALLVREEGHENRKLIVVGDGNWRSKFEALAKELAVVNQVVFTGRMTGQALVNIVSQAEIAVVPSDLEEPMGGVALEMMAAGKNLIVSERGGLAECVGDAGLTFPNTDAKALSLCMKRLLDDAALRQRQKEQAAMRVSRFNESELSLAYYNLFAQVIAKRKKGYAPVLQKFPAKQEANA